MCIASRIPPPGPHSQAHTPALPRGWISLACLNSSPRLHTLLSLSLSLFLSLSLSFSLFLSPHPLPPLSFIEPDPLRNGPANMGVVYHRQRLYALAHTNLPFQVSLNRFGQLSAGEGFFDFHGQWPFPVSARIKHDLHTDELIILGHQVDQCVSAFVCSILFFFFFEFFVELFCCILVTRTAAVV